MPHLSISEVARQVGLRPQGDDDGLLLGQALYQIVHRVSSSPKRSTSRAGERDAAKLVAAGREAFAPEKSVRLDYFEIVGPDTLDSVENISGGALVAVAAFVGGTRLIDNILLPSA